MLQLQPAATDEWLVPVQGLRVRMRPPSSSVLLDARRIYLEWMASGIAPLPQGDDTDAPPKGDYSLRFLLSAAYIVSGAVEWDGLGDETGQPLTQPSDEQVLRLLHQQPAIFDELDLSYSRRLLALVAEKNASAPSPNGSSEREATDTAPTAAKISAVETETPAPTTSTGSKHPQAVASGMSSTEPADS